MKALQLVRVGHALEERQVDTPKTKVNEVLVRVRAAGVCHSDAHYRAGTSPAGPLPLTPGHEVAGVIEAVGADVHGISVGDRVCLHYLVTCGACPSCVQGREQFCAAGQMIGKDIDGGYAEHIGIPARSVLPLPDSVPFEQGAVMMCSSATSLHALHKARLSPGESVAVFGAGGLGMSAVQLAMVCGASSVFAVDIKTPKLDLAERFGAVPVNANADPVAQIMELTGGRGVDVALELVGIRATMEQCVQSLATLGRAVFVGLSAKRFSIAPYPDLINREAELIGVSDHTIVELRQLIGWHKEGKLVFPEGAIRTVPLEAGAINTALDSLDRFGDDIRVVITP